MVLLCTRSDGPEVASTLCVCVVVQARGDERWSRMRGRISSRGGREHRERVVWRCATLAVLSLQRLGSRKMWEESDPASARRPRLAQPPGRRRRPGFGQRPSVLSFLMLDSTRTSPNMAQVTDAEGALPPPLAPHRLVGSPPPRSPQLSASSGKPLLGCSKHDSELTVPLASHMNQDHAKSLG